MRWPLLLLGIVGSQLVAQWCEERPATPLNSSADDFAPVWDRGRECLLLSSTRQGMARIYSAVWLDSTWSHPQELPGLACPGHHLSYAAPDPQGWLYLCRYRPGRRQAYLTIVRARQQRDGTWYWEGVPELAVADAFTAHPALSPDGSILVFASDRPGGAGGTDLWICYRQEDGRWSQPEKLSVLNSPGNEITPFLASSDTLYFASNGHGGAGGYDLFMSVRGWDGQWQPPEPLVELNTDADESDFCVLPFADMALFARGRQGGDLDLIVARRCRPAFLPLLPERPERIP